MSDERPWYLRPVEYNDGGHDDKQADEEVISGSVDAVETFKLSAVGDRSAVKPPTGSTDTSPVDYSRGPHDRAFGVDDADEI